MVNIKSAIGREKEEADTYQTEYDNNINNPKVSEEWREGLADEAEYHQTIAEWLEDYVKCKRAWEEVLQELKSRYNGNNETVGTFTIGIAECIDIINRHLEIKE